MPQNARRDDAVVRRSGVVAADCRGGALWLCVLATFGAAIAAPANRRSRIAARGRARKGQPGRSPGAAAARRDACARRMDPLRDVTRLCQFRAEPAALAEIGRNGLVSPQADGQGSLLVEPGRSLHEGRPSGRACGLGATARVAHRRRPAFLESRLQHGGLPRQFERQGGLSAELAGRRSGVRSCLAHARRERPPRERDRPGEQPGPAQAVWDSSPHEGGRRFGRDSDRGRGCCSTGSSTALRTSDRRCARDAFAASLPGGTNSCAGVVRAAARRHRRA